MPREISEKSRKNLDLPSTGFAGFLCKVPSGIFTGFLRTVSGISTRVPPIILVILIIQSPWMDALVVHRLFPVKSPMIFAQVFHKVSAEVQPFQNYHHKASSAIFFVIFRHSLTTICPRSFARLNEKLFQRFLSGRLLDFSWTSSRDFSRKSSQSAELA